MARRHYKGGHVRDDKRQNRAKGVQEMGIAQNGNKTSNTMLWMESGPRIPLTRAACSMSTDWCQIIGFSFVEISQRAGDSFLPLLVLTHRGAAPVKQHWQGFA